MNLDKILSENIALFVPLAERKSLSIQYEAEDGAIILSDQHVINAVIRNLINNAIKFTPNGGQITITTEKADNFITVSVSDTGVGISENRLAQLFDFEEKNSTVGTNGEVGTGLGLRLCQELLEKQGTTLEIKSEIGKGSVFSFKLPLKLD
jgi:two-component system, sensor histidine kinase and response regulator